MKKSVLAVSAVIVSSMLVVPCSGAAVGDDYQPSFYFKPIETDEAQVLKNGTVYVNSSLLTGENNAFNAEVYIDDDQKLAGHIIVKWKCDSEYIALDNLQDPITWCGTSPYSDFTTPNSIAVTAHPELNKHFVSYSLGMSTEPFKLTSENSDDYPIAGFSAVVNNETPAGRYAVEFMSGESGAQCEILYKYGGDSMNFKGFLPVGDHAKPMKINISDHMLGDIDNDGIIDGTDATQVLLAYTQLSSSTESVESGLTVGQEIAADIDADGIITGSDAMMLLNYYTAISSNCELSIYDYFLQ